MLGIRICVIATVWSAALSWRSPRRDRRCRARSALAILMGAVPEYCAKALEVGKRVGFPVRPRRRAAVTAPIPGVSVSLLSDSATK